MPSPASSLDCYLAEIDRTPLLSAEEEIDLAADIAEGDTEARDLMVRANLRLVVRIAREYVGKGLALEDLIAEGNVGLMRAVEGFDPKAGVRFCTYAAFWVKQSIRVALNRSGHAVRLPQYIGTLLVKWRRAESQLRDELGREPETSEVAERLGLGASQVRAVNKARKAVASGRAAVDEVDLAGILADERTATPADQFENADTLRVAVQSSLDRLGEREATVLRLRFGLNSEEPKTLKEIGECLGLTRERVRQIEGEALAVLRLRLAA